MVRPGLVPQKFPGTGNVPAGYSSVYAGISKPFSRLPVPDEKFGESESFQPRPFQARIYLPAERGIRNIRRTGRAVYCKLDVSVVCCGYNCGGIAGSLGAMQAQP